MPGCRAYTDAGPPFLQTCSEVGEERVRSQEIKLWKESTNLFNIRAICGSSEQPLLGPSEKALNQPKPHPSIELCEGVR